MTKVLPVPVAPSSVCCRRPAVEAVGQLADRFGLIAGGLEGAEHLEVIHRHARRL